MQGILILTEGRSGSNWLGSLMKNTGVMGVPNEWLDWALLKERPATADAYIDAIVARSSTPNGRFAVKLFPRHLRFAQLEYGIDFVTECRRRHDIGLIRLSRNDRMRQAISYARGMMTAQWTSRNDAKAEARYSFQAISEAYFYIDRSEAFWDSYLGLAGLSAPHFAYEDMLGDPRPFVDEAARILGVSYDGGLKTDLKIQRDATTEEWLERYEAEVATRSPLAFSTGRPASRTVANLKRFFRREPLTPF